VLDVAWRFRRGVALSQTSRNTSAWSMVVEKRDAFYRGEKNDGGTPTSQADTA